MVWVYCGFKQRNADSCKDPDNKAMIKCGYAGCASIVHQKCGVATVDGLLAYFCPTHVSVMVCCFSFAP